MKRILISIAAISGLVGLFMSASGAPFALTSTLTNFSTFITTGDLNGDGRPDLVSVDGQGSFTVDTNAGKGAFISNRTYSVGNGSQPVFAAVADVDTNGGPDIVTANFFNNTVSVFTNAGGGIFVSNASYTVGSGPDCIVAQDINGDGKPDIITANFNDQTLTILTNSGGRFPVSHTISNIFTYIGPQYGPQTFAVADINGDGKRDIIALNLAGSGASFEVLTNAGGGNFITNLIYFTGYSIQALVVSDFNKDGKMDVAALSQFVVIVFTNGANGVLTMAQTIALPGLAGPAPDFPPFYQGDSYLYPQMAAADLDGDSYTDLVVVAGISVGSLHINDVELLFNNGSGGTFSTNYLTPGAPGAVGITNSTGMYIPGDGSYIFPFAATDINGDGKSDFIGGEQAGGQIFAMTNVISNVISLAVPANIVVNVGPYGFAQVNFAPTWTNWMGSLPTTNTPYPADFPFTPGPTNIITTSTGYQLTSALSGSSNATITVSVRDVPILRLFGPNPLTNFVGGYVEAGATVSDPGDNPLIYVSGNLNTNVPGTYTVTYSATNHFGNFAATNRTVVMIPVPSLGIASAAGNQTSLFWPASAATNYTVQMTTNLSSGPWVNVPANNLLMGISVTNSTSPAFFRFKSQ